MFEFTLPTENTPQSPRWLAASIAVHALAILLMFAIRISTVSGLPSAREHYTLLAPSREMRVAPPKARLPRPREFSPLPAMQAHLTAPAVPRIAAPEIQIPGPPMPEFPRTAPPVPAMSASAFPDPKPVAPPLSIKPAIRTAGFDRADTPVITAAHPILSTPGSFASANSAPDATPRGTVSRTGGFSDGSATATSMPHQSAIATAAFGDATIEKTVASRQAAAPARLTAVEILAKPKPAYTAEARAKNIEGEVLIELKFSAAASVQILRVVRGLGSGLDETAIAAAQGIRFRPALRDGQPVDTTALVHIVFQLAN